MTTANRHGARPPVLENELRRSEERFRLLVDSVIDYAIFILDPDGRISSWNPGAERIKGYRADEVIGKHFSLFYTPEAIERDHPGEELKLAARDGRYHEEGWRVRKDGSHFWADVTITALVEDGKLQGFAKVTRDLSERKVQENALKEANASLERRVQERTAELAALNAELASFSYSVSHDLRAPLRAIDGFSRVLIEDYGDGKPLDKQGLHYLERISHGAQRMATLTDDLLNLSRITRADFRRIPVDLAEIARDVVDALKQQSPGRVVAVTLPPAASASGDPRLLRVVLENLLGNAWKFTSKTPNASIELGAENTSGERAFFIRDNGAGFDMAYADKLFAPFQRLHEEDEFEGTGIGLATVQRAIRRHGGRVWAHGEPERGATFWFTLGEA